MLSNLTKNVCQFSAAKNYQEMKDFTLALRDGNRVRTFSEFKEACGDINQKYMKWLNTEYNQAIASSQMAGRWAEFTDSAEDMPMLQYQTVGDSNVRDSHAMLNDIKKPVDDSFWNSYFPPNGWGCRCDVIQITKKNAKPTKTNEKHMPTVPSMWKINVGKEGVAFPPQSAYYKDIPHAAWVAVKSEVKAVVNKHYSHVVMQQVALTIPEGLEIKTHPNLYTGAIRVSRSDARVVANHLSGSNKLLTIECIKNIAHLKPLKENITKTHESLKQKQFKAFNYYTLTINKKDYVVNVGVTHNGEEKLYAIRTKKND